MELFHPTPFYLELSIIRIDRKSSESHYSKQKNRRVGNSTRRFDFQRLLLRSALGAKLNAGFNDCAALGAVLIHADRLTAFGTELAAGQCCAAMRTGRHNIFLESIGGDHVH